MKHINIRVKADNVLWNDFKEKAKKNGKTLEAAFAEAINTYVNKK